MEPRLAMRTPTSVSAILYLDAAQLAKHAFGLSLEIKWVTRSPALLYLYPEPAHVSAFACSEDRAEIESFATAAPGARVRVAATSWAD